MPADYTDLNAIYSLKNIKPNVKEKKNWTVLIYQSISQT